MTGITLPSSFDGAPKSGPSQVRPHHSSNRPVRRQGRSLSVRRNAALQRGPCEEPLVALHVRQQALKPVEAARPQPLAHGHWASSHRCRGDRLRLGPCATRGGIRGGGGASAAIFTLRLWVSRPLFSSSSLAARRSPASTKWASWSPLPDEALFEVSPGWRTSSLASVVSLLRSWILVSGIQPGGHP